jgi:hypothetical protein
MHLRQRQRHHHGASRHDGEGDPNHGFEQTLAQAQHVSASSRSASNKTDRATLQHVTPGREGGGAFRPLMFGARHSSSCRERLRHHAELRRMRCGPTTFMDRGPLQTCPRQTGEGAPSRPRPSARHAAQRRTPKRRRPANQHQARHLRDGEPCRRMSPNQC